MSKLKVKKGNTAYRYTRLFSPRGDDLWIYHQTLAEDSRFDPFVKTINRYFSTLSLLPGDQGDLATVGKNISALLNSMADIEFNKELEFLRNFCDEKTIKQWKNAKTNTRTYAEMIDNLNKVLTHPKLYEEHKKIFQGTSSLIKTYQQEEKKIYKNMSSILGDIYYEIFNETWEEVFIKGTQAYNDFYDLIQKSGYSPVHQGKVNFEKIAKEMIAYISVKALRKFLTEENDYYKGFLKGVYEDEIINELNSNMLRIGNAQDFITNFSKVNEDLGVLLKTYFSEQALSPLIKGIKTNIMKSFNQLQTTFEERIKENYLYHNSKKRGITQLQKGSIGGNVAEALDAALFNVMDRKERKNLYRYMLKSTEYSNDNLTIFIPGDVYDFENAQKIAKDFADVTQDIKGKKMAAEKYIEFVKKMPPGSFVIVDSMKYPYIEKLTSQIDIEGTSRTGKEVDAIIDHIFEGSSRKREQYFNALVHFIYEELYFPNRRGEDRLSAVSQAIIPYLGSLIFDEFNILGKQDYNTSSSNTLFLFQLGHVRIPISHLLRLLADNFEETIGKSQRVSVRSVNSERSKGSQYRLFHKNLEVHISLGVRPLQGSLSEGISRESDLVNYWKKEEEDFITFKKLETNFFKGFAQYLRDIFKELK